MFVFNCLFLCCGVVCILLVVCVLVLFVVVQLCFVNLVSVLDLFMQVFKCVDCKMMEVMESVLYMGDVDCDFVLYMVLYYQGVIDMVQVELKYGKDLMLWQFVSWIVVVQCDEIVLMECWQKEYGKML